jgi:RND family efflux transporter MFP subunit
MEAKKANLSALRINKESRPAGSSTTRNTITIVVVLIAVIAAAVYGWNWLVAPAIEVKLTTATMMSPAQSNAVLTASGYVVAQRKAAVASKATGRLIKLNVVEGDRVKKDEIIAELEDSDIRTQLDQARANLKVNEADLKDAQQTLARQKSLLEKGLTSQAEYDAVESRLQRVMASIEYAKATIASAAVAMENTRIRAPFNGTVLTKNADVGEMVVPMAASVGSKSAVVTIADMTSLQVEADVSESNIQRITVNQPCEITLDAYPEVRYQGFVAKIVPTADRAKATVMTKVGFASYDSRVLPEMSAKVLFLTRANDQAQQQVKPFLTVIASAVVERNGRRVVFVVQEGRAVEVEVSLGRTVGAYVEITSGLTSGDKVIEKVDGNVQGGVKVKPV